MKFHYEMPANVFFGRNAVAVHAEEFEKAGKMALIVTGKSSAKRNGAYEDVSQVLKERHIGHVVFDQVEENPSLETIEKAAQIGKENQVDFVIGIGGGSPMDAAKAVAVFIKNPEIDRENIFCGKALEHIPVIAVATTSGTGSEVTPYSIVTSKAEKTKKNLGQIIFPKAAFLDSKYTFDLPYEITLHTAIDAFSHLVEGYLNVNSSVMSDMYAEKGFALFSGCLENLVKKEMDEEFRDTIMLVSMLGGIQIAQTGTSLPHGMGYHLTYHKGVPHGMANGVLTTEYLKIFRNQDKINRMLSILRFHDIEEFSEMFQKLVHVQISITEEEIMEYSTSFISNKAKVMNHPEAVELNDIVAIYRNSLLF